MVNDHLEEEVEEYLNLKKKATSNEYRVAFRKFLEYYTLKHGGKGFGDYLDRIFAELKKDRRDQKRVAETELVEFINFLKDKGMASNTIRTYFAAVQNFLVYKQVVVSAGFIGNLPAPVSKASNEKHEWTIEQIKQFRDAARSYRDKSIIEAMFQSGLGIHEIVSLDYKHIQEEYEAGITPICLRLVRQKTEIKFKTFFGYDTITYLRLYLQTRKKLSADSPLFTMLGTEKRVSPAAIQQAFSEIAKDLPFVKRGEKRAYNPCRPHSLRAAFNSRLKNKVSDDLIEFWSGHALGAVKEAYLTKPTEELRQDYMDAERHLTIDKSSRDALAEVEKASPVIEQKVKALEETVAEQKAEIASLKSFIDYRAEEVTIRLMENWLKKQDKRMGIQ